MGKFPQKGSKLQQYELLYIVHPDLESSIDKITAHAKDIIEGRKGKITYEENWGKRKLAYPIKKADVGIYVLWYFEAPTTALSKIERDLRLTEEIIRYMVLATPEKITEAKPKKVAPKAEEKAPESKEVAEVKAAKKPTVKKAAEKKEKAPVESEKERMKKLDEKLGALLGEEEDNKKK